MTIGNQQENWQVEVGGQIYDAAPAELPEWIIEGSLLPGDKVRKGNLRWIEAGKVPALVPFFNAKETGCPPPVGPLIAVSAPVDEVREDIIDVVDVSNITTAQPVQISGTDKKDSKNEARQSDRAACPDVCSVHTETRSFYFCGPCASAFCKNCPTSFGSEVRICPNCGAFCSPILKAAEEARLWELKAAHVAEGFGPGDCFRSLAYPFKFKPSLIFGALMFMFFTVGQSASAIGGMIMWSASLICLMLANMLTFGIMANTVDNFTQGRLDADFMPGFDDFSIWDSIIHPFLLSIGAYLSSFGPFFAIAALGAYLFFSSVSEQTKKFESELAAVPGTQFYGPDRTLEQSQEVKDLLAAVKQQNEQRLDRQTQTADGEPAPLADDDSREFERLMQETRAAQFESSAEKRFANQELQGSQVFSGIIRLPAPLVVLGAIAFLWGLFYFPAACAVAAYSRSFAAAINPLVGIDTIRRLGFRYFKVLLMGLCILIAWAVAGILLSLLFAPVDLPKLGNLPATIVGSLFTFYFWIVFSCVLGLALYKAGDRLKLHR